MTKAEKASIAYQLVAHGPRVMGGDAVLSDDDFKFWNINYDFVAGYEQAEKDLGWHSVEESLPPIDEEVIVLTDEMHGKKLHSACHISYGHRPNPEGWDGKSIFTGKVTHHNVVTYDGWNIPGVKYWMPMPKLPKEEENETK